MSADNLMSDAVMVPRADPDAIWLEPSCCADPSHGRQWCEDDAFPVCEDGREPVKYIRAGLAASTPVGCRERTDVQRLMDPVRAYLWGMGIKQRIAEEASERAVDAMYRALNAPPSVSIDNGSRPPFDERDAWGIVNPFGVIWTPITFAREADGWAHLKRFWSNNEKAMQGFKVVPCAVSVRILPQTEKGS